MSKTMVQIRNVPPELHRLLKARAALEGMSMSEYVLRELRKSLERPMRHEVLERLRTQADRVLKLSPTEAIRMERDAR